MTSACSRRRTVCAAAACLMVLGLPGLLRADFTYIDGSFGLSLSLPDGTSVGRVKSPAGETGTEIAQFTLPDGNTLGRIVVSELPVDWTFETGLKLVREQLAKDTKVSDAQLTAERAQVQGPVRNAQLMGAWHEEHQLYNGILMIQGPSQLMFVLYVAVRGAPRETAQRTVKALAEGVTVLTRPGDEQRVQDALSRGLEWLMSLAAPPPAAGDLWEEQHFLIQGPQEPLGYLVVREELQERSGRPGLAMTSEKWVFWPAGGAEYEMQSAFASWDLSEEDWTSHVEVVVETPGQAPRLVPRDQRVLRMKRSLVIQAADGTKEDKGQNRVLEECPRSFLPLAWKWLAPRLLAKKAPQGPLAVPGEWLALVTYSPQRRGLETQMLAREVYGTTRQVVQREGLYGATETWQFGPDGRLREIQAAGLRLIPASETEVRTRFAGRIALWRQKLGMRKP